MWLLRDGHQQRRDAVGDRPASMSAPAATSVRADSSRPSRAAYEKRRQAAGNQVPRPALRQTAADDADAVAEAGDRVRQHPGRRRARFASAHSRRRAARRAAARRRDGFRGRRPSAPSAGIPDPWYRPPPRGRAAPSPRRDCRRATPSSTGFRRSDRPGSDPRPTSSSSRIIVGVPVGAREIQRRDAVPIGARGIGAGANQQPRRSRDRRREPASAGRACRRVPGALTSTF